MSYFHSLLHMLRRRDWVVYSKPPFGGPEHVLKYLARYTHRVAISNGRLLSLDNGQVRFRWRDSRHNNRSGVMTLDAVEFIRRFLLHVLPSGFVKIRHFGLVAKRSRRQALALCRIHLSASTHVRKSGARHCADDPVSCSSTISDSPWVCIMPRVSPSGELASKRS
jgi:Putative transposase